MLLRTRQFAAFLIHCDGWIGDDSMRRQAGFFDVDDRLKRLSDLGDQLEAFEAAVEFEAFRPELNAALTYSDGTQGGRPPFDPVMMFKILVLQTTNNLSDERAEFLINDRLSFMRFTSLTRRREWTPWAISPLCGHRFVAGVVDTTTRQDRPGMRASLL